MLKKILILLCLNIGIFNLSNASSELPVLSGVGGNFSAVDMHNNPMQMNDYKGKVVILGFGYTNCADICPFTLGYLKQLYEQLPDYAQKQLQIMFVTVDPEYDTPAHLKNFIAHFNQKFVGITGTRAQIDNIVQLFKARYTQIGGNVDVENIRRVVQKQTTDKSKVRLYNHSVTLYLIDQDGEARHIGYTGTPKAEFSAHILSLMNAPIKTDKFRMKQGASNARSTAAYGEITNLANTDDILLSVSSTIAKRTELHETQIIDGFAKMVHQPNRAFAAKETLILKPMSYHVMFMGLKQPVHELKTIDIVLHFKNAGKIPVRINLER